MAETAIRGGENKVLKSGTYIPDCVFRRRFSWVHGGVFGLYILSGTRETRCIFTTYTNSPLHVSG